MSSRQLEQNGLSPDELSITEQTLHHIIREYTWESGVRNLEREIGKLCRRIARQKAEGKKVYRRITPSMLAKIIGPPQIIPHEMEQEDQVGLATGLAWTENGGDTISVEALLVEGKGGLQITGHIGEVMQESAHAALSYVKSLVDELKIDVELFEKMDIHIHVPEGAIPKDGPSAGITMATALASVMTGRAVRKDVGMSGEITLRGRVLAIGGVRAKIHAAYRLGLKCVIIPAKNDKDLLKIPRQAKNSIDIQMVQTMREVLDLALVPEVQAPRRRSAGRSKGTRDNPVQPSA